MKFSTFNVSARLKAATTDKQMRPYYIGMLVLAVAIIAIALITIIGNWSLKSDFALEKRLTLAKTDIDSYVGTNKALPKTLGNASKNKNEGIEYKQANDKRYFLCATFRTKSNGFQEPTPAYVDDIKNNLMAGANLSADAHLTNGDTEGLKHEKGYTCIVYDPYQLSDEYTKPYIACGTDRYKQTLTSRYTTWVDGTNHQALLGFYDYTLNPAVWKSVTYKLAPDVKYYDSNCKGIAASDIKINTYVDLYLNDSTSELIEAIKVQPGNSAHY